MTLLHPRLSLFATSIILSLLPLGAIALDYDIRLEGGSSDQEGRVEVFLNGQWGTVCDDQWDDRDAAVVCRQLGYLGPAVAKISAFFGKGSGDIVVDDVGCNGTETSLSQCTVSPIVHNCAHNEDAGVICSKANGQAQAKADYVIRLEDGSSELQGRVEVLINGRWGTVCDDVWDENDAIVVCRQLGFLGPARAIKAAVYGEGSGDIVLDDVECLGSETNLGQCNASVIEHNCAHAEDAGVICSELKGETPADYSVRLEGGSHPREGRVEVFLDGAWGTVCDDDWGYDDAKVVCRQLGFLGSTSARPSAYFGAGSGSIVLDNVACLGTETNLRDCQASKIDHNCDHSEDAGVFCGRSNENATISEGAVRLVGGPSSQAGTVEIFFNGEWGTVCDDGWSLSDATVVCRQLGFARASNFLTKAFYGEGGGSIAISDVDCWGMEKRLLDCSYAQPGCSHAEDAGVECVLPENGDVRLVGSGAYYEGRVEVYFDGQWGTVCDKSWSDVEADVVCRELGYVGADSPKYGAFYGSGTGPIAFGNVTCPSFSVDRLINCEHVMWPRDNCSHENDAGVKCSTDLSSAIIGGIITGFIAGIFLLCFCCWYYCCKSPKKKPQQSTTAGSSQAPSGYTQVTQEPSAVVHPPPVAQCNPAQGNVMLNPTGSYQDPLPPSYNEVLTAAPPQHGQQYPVPSESKAPYPAPYPGAAPYPAPIQASAPYLPPGHTPLPLQFPPSSENGASAPPYPAPGVDTAPYHPPSST